jgi:hypothetical protein
MARVEIGADGLPNGKFLYRDLGDTAIDLQYRKQIGRRNPRRLPRISERFDIDYRTGEKVASRFANVSYFSEGFLYNLDQRLPEWSKRGLIGRVQRTSWLRGENRYFRTMLDAELGRAYAEMTGSARAPGGLQARTERGRKLMVQRFAQSGKKRPRPLARPRNSPIKLVNRIPPGHAQAGENPAARGHGPAGPRAQRGARAGR